MDVLFELDSERFVWDSDKAALNLVKHGVRFETAAEAFLDPLAIFEDAGTPDEARQSILGFNKTLDVIFVVHLVREDQAIRLISARYATAKERRAHANND